MDGKLVFKVTKLFVSVWSDKAKHVKLPALSFYFVSFLSVKNVKLLADLLVKVKTSFRLVPQCSLNNLAQGSEARWLANQRSLCSNKFFQIGRFLLLFWNTRQWYFVWKIWKLFTQQVGTRSDYFKSCSPWCNTKKNEECNKYGNKRWAFIFGSLFLNISYFSCQNSQLFLKKNKHWSIFQVALLLERASLSEGKALVRILQVETPCQMGCGSSSGNINHY